MLNVATGVGRLEIQCWDWDKLTSDDFIGQGSIEFSELASQPNTPKDYWVDLQPEGGRLHFSLEYFKL